jgi:hypothetical protein
MNIREKIDNFYEKVGIGVWGLISFGGFLFLGLLISQIGVTDLLGCPYRWYNHAVSELGMAITGNWSWLLFNICLICGGIISLFFFLGFSLYFEGKYAALVAKIGLILAIIWALTLIGVGLNPADVRNKLHYNVSVLFFLSSFIMSVVFNIAILVQDKEANRQKIPRWTSIIGITASILSFIIFTQDLSVGASFLYLIPGICREKIIPALFWEWIAFYSIEFWGIFFSLLTLKKSTRKQLDPN